MKKILKRKYLLINGFVAVTMIGFVTSGTAVPLTINTKPPNVILIFTDDLGYGDLSSYQADSKIKTPHIDRLASEGMMFTDAHSSSAVCTPSRYSLLTGRYCWRTELKSGVQGGYGLPLIEPDRLTLAPVSATGLRYRRHW